MKRSCAGLRLVWLVDINSKGGSLYVVMTYHSYGALRGFITQKSGADQGCHHVFLDRFNNSKYVNDWRCTIVQTIKVLE